MDKMYMVFIGADQAMVNIPDISYDQFCKHFDYTIASDMAYKAYCNDNDMGDISDHNSEIGLPSMRLVVDDEFHNRRMVFVPVYDSERVPEWEAEELPFGYPLDGSPLTASAALKLPNNVPFETNDMSSWKDYIPNLEYDKDRYGNERVKFKEEERLLSLVHDVAHDGNFVLCEECDDYFNISLPREQMVEHLEQLLLAAKSMGC